MLALLLLFAQILAQTFDIRSAISSDGLVHGNDRVIDRIFRAPRDFDVVLILTAENPKFQCGFCQTLGPDLREVATMYNKQHENPELFFVLADLDFSQQVFQQLEISTAPHLFYYPRETNPSVYNKRLKAPSDHITFANLGPQVQTIVNIIGRKGHHVTIVRPIRYDKILNAVGTLVAGIVGTVVFWSKVKALYQSKKLWLASSLVLILLFISGHMFNVTRGTQFMGFHNGQPEYIQRGFGGQYGVETQILAVTYAALSFCTILLMTRLPAADEGRQMVIGAVLVTTVLVVYSVLIGVFKLKFPGFPFALIDIKF